MDSIITGRIVTPDAILDRGWIAVAGEKIVAIGDGPPPTGTRRVDYGDNFVLPGLIDGQTHATNAGGLAGIGPHSRSAIAGGVTTIVDMPYDAPLPLDRPARLEAKIDAIRAYAHCDIALYATVTRDSGLAYLDALLEAGVCAFKISSFEASATRFPRIDQAMTLDLLTALAASRVPLGLHNEDQEIVHAHVARLRASGRDDIMAHSDSRPLAAELSATAQFLALGQATGGHAHIVHLSHEDGFAQVAAFERLGARVTGELCVHYLCFDAADDGATLGARMKVNPPVRAGAIAGLWRALGRGDVAFVSSDHASWPLDRKDGLSIYDAGAGVPGLETLGPAFFSAARAQGHEAARMTAACLSQRPARFFGLSDRKGAIAAGMDADFCVLEPGRFVWDAARAHDGLNWSPFDGRVFDARTRATWLRGKEAWDGDQVMAHAGEGRFLPRGAGLWFDEIEDMT